MPPKNPIVLVDGTRSKRCGRCHEIKPVSAFNSCKYSATGYRSQCKSCMQDQRSSMREYYKGWRSQDSVKKFYREYSTRMQKDFPIRQWARNKARALKRNPCQVCGSDVVEAHHTDYLEPVDVMWLCREHHIEWHMKNGPGLNHDAPVPNRSNEAEDAA